MKKWLFLYLCGIMFVFVPAVFALDEEAPLNKAPLDEEVSTPSVTEVEQASPVNEAEISGNADSGTIEGALTEAADTEDEAIYPPPESFPGLAEPSMPPLTPVRTTIPEEPYTSRPDRVPAQTVILPPASRRPIKVLPKMPDAHNGKKYRVQLGAFSKIPFAQECFERLKSAGFSPYYEEHGSLYRVVLSGIPAAGMVDITQRLEAAGFAEAWVREEK